MTRLRAGLLLPPCTLPPGMLPPLLPPGAEEVGLPSVVTPPTVTEPNAAAAMSAPLRPAAAVLGRAPSAGGTRLPTAAGSSAGAPSLLFVSE